MSWMYPLFVIAALAQSEEGSEIIQCENDCGNGGVCNNSTGLCECSFGCYGDFCETCPLSSAFTISLLLFLVLCVIVMLVYKYSNDRIVFTLFKLKRYHRVDPAEDPFLTTLQTVTNSASSKNSTLGNNSLEEDHLVYGNNSKQWWKTNSKKSSMNDTPV